MSTVATVHYSGIYKGAPVSGSVPVWSRFNSSDEVGRLLYAVITGRSLHKEGGRVNWSMGESDFVAWVPSPKADRPAPFLRFTFDVRLTGADVPLYEDGKSPAIRAFEHLDRLAEHPITLPETVTECDEVAASMSDKAPHFATFDEASRWVRARMPGESMTVIDNTAESLMASQRKPDAPSTLRKPTPAPTFSDDVPEPAFDILSEQSGIGARRVFVYRVRYQPSIDYVVSAPGDLPATSPLPSDIVAWKSFETVDGWSWRKTGGYQNPDCDPLFL